MEFCWVLPVTRNIESDELYDLTISQSILAEQNNFDSLLVATIPEALDPWILSTNIVNVTQSIRILIAQNTNHVLPTYTAKALNTLNMLSNGRIDVNLVTGSSSLTLSRDNKVENHKTRYKRTEEFSEILNIIHKGPLTYKGDFYNIENCDLYPNNKENRQGRIFIAGSSEECQSIAARYGDTHLMYANSFDETKKQIIKVRDLAKNMHRDIKCGIYINVIARETSDEAWNTAYKILEDATPIEKKLVKMYQNTADSVGVMKHREFKSYDQYKVDENLWGGLAEVSSTVAMSIVGSYEEVAKTLKKYNNIGVDYFLLVGYCNDNEIERIGKNVLSHLKDY
ncbi:LLM class flavin-dependent oxidoreductase [Priestia filamentosa]|uniref:LLM class flavin-dependent oxidoreductase n=1 Tax=Priestia filamentosa TaxID=1402861 RepID=UPI001FB21971|nr:LLM class flavin-dependent oxidoreductase [Priestia filamentosa]UOE58259.1 LLM class flavin-dependent oxidoreductase [Priestia filamentosa]